MVKKSLNPYQLELIDVLRRGYVADRDENAARNILEIGLRTVGHTGTSTRDVEKASETR